MRLYEDLRGVQQRVSILQSGVALLVALLLAAFWYLQVVKVGYYRIQAENNHKREVRLPASRTSTPRLFTMARRYPSWPIRSRL